MQKALETYRIPADVKKKVSRKKLNRCFRDQDEMPLANDLGSSIEKALRDSEWLILICTPDLLRSSWCLKEVDYFIELGRRDKIIPVLVSGEPSESFPPQIFMRETEYGSEEIEPLAADLRGNMKKQLKTEKLRIVARMLNLNFNDLKKRERERELRRRLIIVSVVLAAALCFGAYAIYKNRVLTQERNASAHNATQLLIEKSVRSSREREMGSGLLYALQAYDNSRIFGDEYNEEIAAALEAAMYPEPFSVIGTLQDNGILHRTATLSNDGRFISCRQADGSLLVYSSISGEKLFSVRDFGWFGKSTPDFTPDSRYVCKFSENTLIFYEITDGTEVLSKTIPDGWSIPYNGLTVNNEVPLISANGGKAALYDPFNDKITVLDGISVADVDKCAVDIHRSGRRLAWSDGTQTYIVDTESKKVLLTLSTAVYSSDYPEAFSAGYTDDSWYFRYKSGSEYVFLRWDTLEEVCRNKNPGVLSPDGKLLAVAKDIEGFTLYDAATGKELWTDGHNSGNTLYGLAFADNDTLIASHEEVQIYRIHDKKVVYDSGKDRTTYGFDFAEGRLVMPLRAGGCQVNLLPEDSGKTAVMTVETRDSYPESDFGGMTTLLPLSGSYNGMNFNSLDSGSSGNEGLYYEFEGKKYFINPVKGISTPFIYVSADGKWQAIIRDEEVDVFRAEEGSDPVMTIPGNGYNRLCVALGGDLLALGSYVENLTLYDLSTGECLGSIDTGAMCTNIQFSEDGKHVIAYSAMAEQVTVADTLNFSSIMKIPVTEQKLMSLTVCFNKDETEAAVIYPDGHADVGLMYRDLDTLVEKAKKYTE